MFESNVEVLKWYENQEPTLTKEFIDNLPWDEVRNCPISAKLIPVLVYMRDVETLTEIYHQQLLRTPTGKDPIIGKFMERWGTEELVHGELLNRFLSEVGIDISDNWLAETKQAIPFSYKFNTRITTMLTNCVGKNFTAAHMAYGAINELSTLQGYRRLIQIAKHPVLTQILKAIMREESIHVQFYWNVAKIELENSKFSRQITRFIIKNFWVPVGQGAKPVKDANYTISTLFGGEGGAEFVNKHVSRRIQDLPGLHGINIINQRIAEACAAEI
ncbi:MAG: acyl-ACP desaturase [Pyrinomonadaceae bacterium]|nr:acyl-ACP desaturase [Pyrinomonadaceae bacterium]